ncbi:MAG: hypothetical protein KAW56_05070 [Candidatus Marinimicrobia bacterium]|nr:hypothetical protein [Candidatus Neomarinimicrobiota bacterium]MCK4446432.1 hypothetical protein [Candidatus Neomarinimicrobiota bacterium]
MKNWQFIGLIVLLFLLSCSKETDHITTSDSESPMLLTKITYDGEVRYKYFYDSENRLIQMKTFYNDSCTSTESYEYNKQYKFEKRFYDSFEESYEYNDQGLLISRTGYYEKTEKTWEEEYHYNSKDQIENGIVYFNGEKIGYITYQYNESGNTTVRKEYGNDDFLVSEYRFTFDNFNSPFALTFPLDIIRKNNITKYYYYSVVMSAPPPEYSATFEYNSERLPVKETRIIPYSEESVIVEYSYNSSD